MAELCFAIYFVPTRDFRLSYLCRKSRVRYFYSNLDTSTAFTIGAGMPLVSVVYGASQACHCANRIIIFHINTNLNVYEYLLNIIVIYYNFVITRKKSIYRFLSVGSFFIIVNF